MKHSHFLLISLCGSGLLAACGSGATPGDTATHLSVTAAATATAGTAFQFTVTALDAGNHAVVSYSGTVHFSSTDGQATLPANSTLMNGMGTFSATLRSAGTETIAATDAVTASITGTSASIAVISVPATQFSISAPSTAKRGTAFNFTVTARDAANNVATGYSGTVHFSSTDPQAMLPANSVLPNAKGTFSATLQTDGSQTITATDTVEASITGTSNSILVALALACSPAGSQCRPDVPCCSGSMCAAEGDREYCVAGAGAASTAPGAGSRFESMFGAAVVRQRGVATLPDAAVSLPAAQKPPTASYRHHHYKFVDLGTFGGPASYINTEPTQLTIINNAGTIVGGADTPISTPVVSCYNPVLNPDCYIFHAFTWDGGGLKDLGTLDRGTFSFAEAVNNIGQIAGVSENGRIDPVSGNPIFHAVLWQSDRIMDLGTLGGNSSFAGSISELGEVSGVALNDIPDLYSIFGLIGGTASTQTRAFLWQGGEMRDLGTLGGPDAFAEFMNKRGDVAGVSYTSNTADPSTGLPHLDPFLWHDGRMKDLGDFGGTNDDPNGAIPFFVPFVSGLNNLGQVVGSMTLPGDQVAHAFLWDGEKLSDLNALRGGLGGNFSFAGGLNDAGEVVGLATIPGDQLNHAVLWANGTTTDLGTLAGDVCSGAENINSIGQIVGSSQDAMCNPFTHAFLWENGGPMVDLSKLVTANLPLHLKVAYLITDGGEIVGSGSPLSCSVDVDGCEPHVFVLIPCDENHPDIEGCDYSLVDVKATAEVRPAVAPSKSKVTLAEMTARIRALRTGHNRWLGTRRPAGPDGSTPMFAQVTTSQPPGIQVAVESSTNLAAPTASFTPDAVSIFCQVTPASSRAFYFCPVPRTVTLENTGSSTLYVFGVGIGGAQPAEFAQEDNCPASLRPGQSCAITVRYAGHTSITVINLHKEVTYSGSLVVRVNTVTSGETAITKEVPLRAVLPPAE